MPKGCGTRGYARACTSGGNTGAIGGAAGGAVAGLVAGGGGVVPGAITGAAVGYVGGCAASVWEHNSFCNYSREGNGSDKSNNDSRDNNR